MTTTVYRQSRTFPPDEASYVSVAERRAGKSFGNPTLDLAARGLSVLESLEAARGHARENRRLGNIIVRYHIPDDVEFDLRHLTGNPAHLTLTMAVLTDLAQFLDREWWEVLDIAPTSRR